MANKRGYRLKSIGDVSHCLAKTVNELRRGEIEIAEARGRGYLLNILLTALKASELEERLNTDFHYVLETLKLTISLTRFQILVYNYQATQFGLSC